MTALLESEAACLEPASPLETFAGIGQTGDPMRVLFVEDDRYHRELLLTELSKRGFAGWGFADSASLLGALDTGVDADIILVLDGGLSRTSDIDLLALLRRHGVDLPVVFLAGRPLTTQESVTLGGVRSILSTRHVAWMFPSDVSGARSRLRSSRSIPGSTKSWSAAILALDRTSAGLAVTGSRSASRTASTTSSIFWCRTWVAS
jgi:CheY-like chemotaxis protein